MKLTNMMYGITFVAAVPVGSYAEAPGQGLTARYEVAFMESTIDHHFAALRITELAVGTDLQRNAAITVT